MDTKIFKHVLLCIIAVTIL